MKSKRRKYISKTNDFDCI